MRLRNKKIWFTFITLGIDDDKVIEIGKPFNFFLESHLEMILSVFTIKTEDLFVTMMQQEKYE